MPSTESFYGGAKYPLDPSYGNPVAYKTSFAELGTSVDARTANQIKEVSKHLNTGIKTIEVSGHSPEVFEAIPKEHLKELNRLAKLTGSDLTFHAPMIDPSGITQHGWDKIQQEAAAQQLWSAVERSHDLDPRGNIMVTMHASTAPVPTETRVKEGKEEKVKSIVLVTPDGRITQIKEEEKFFPEAGKFTPGKPREFIPKQAIIEENERFLTGQVEKLLYSLNITKRNLDEITSLKENVKQRIESQEKLSGEKIPEQIKEKMIAQTDEQIKSYLPQASLSTRAGYDQLKQMFDLVYKATEQGSTNRQKLDNFAKKIVSEDIHKLSSSENPEDVKRFSELVQEGVSALGKLKDVQVLKPLRDFAIEKTAETTADLAFKGFKKFGETAPVISLENHPAQQSLLTTGQDLKEVIQAARKNFVRKAMKEKGLSEGEAKQQASKLIGATWDVGHINMLRRYGFDKSDIIKETEKVAPFVKHVHLSDNFGFEHTELPMGMGNVPMKQIMEKLGKEGFKGKKVAEALSWWQHFSEQGTQHAIIPTMQAMNSPIYGMQMGPAWNQYTGVAGGYFSGYGAINPEIHHSLYGAGFSSLPTELGGQVAGKDSRFSGTPMS